jgi:hypothetical protein
MRYHSKMDSGVMLALLSASPVLVWRRFRVDASRRPIQFTRETLAAINGAHYVPDTVTDGSSLEIAGRAGDTPTEESLGDVNRKTNCQNLDTPSVELDEQRVANSAREVRICATWTDLAQEVSFLVLRFRSQRATARFGAEG